MIILQIIPREGLDAYKLLRDKVTHEARTWAWANKAKTRLKHRQIKDGYIEVGSSEGVLVAQIRPSEPDQAYFLTEKFVGRLIAWFEQDLAAMNLQFLEVAPKRRRRRR